MVFFSTSLGFFSMGKKNCSKGKCYFWGFLIRLGVGTIYFQLANASLLQLRSTAWHVCIAT